MTRVDFLGSLKAFTRAATQDILLPVRMQEGDEVEPPPRAAGVYLMRVKKSSASHKAAPYIMHQIITGKDVQPKGGRTSSFVVLRSVFCVYDEDEEAGGLALLGLCERLRIALLKTRQLSGRFSLVSDGDGLETLIYPDDTAPYYIGEFVGTWQLPGVEREVDLHNGY